MTHDCKIAERLELAHKWAHRCADLLSLNQHAEALELSAKILAYIDDTNAPNGVKLLALIETLHVGAEAMEYHDMMQDDPDAGTATVN